MKIQLTVGKKIKLTNYKENPIEDCKEKFIKVENILKGSLDLIHSPSDKIQIMGGKVCLLCKGKTLLGIFNKLLKTKFINITQQCFASLPQLNSPANILNFH